MAEMRARGKRVLIASAGQAGAGPYRPCRQAEVSVEASARAAVEQLVDEYIREGSPQKAAPLPQKSSYSMSSPAAAFFCALRGGFLAGSPSDSFAPRFLPPPLGPPLGWRLSRCGARRGTAA